MLVEGRDALFATLVPNLRNPGPLYVEWNNLGMDQEARRAAFVVTEHPLIFQQTAPKPPLEQVIAAEGYRVAFEGELGSLLVPGQR